MGDEPPPSFDVAAVWAAVRRYDVEFLRRAIVWVALDAEDYEAARELCVALSSHNDEFVRGNAILGFGHLARRFRVAHRDDIEIVRRARVDRSRLVRGHAYSAISDIEMFDGLVEFTRRDLTIGDCIDESTHEKSQAVFVGWLGRAWSGTGCQAPRLRDALITAWFSKSPPVSERNIMRHIDSCPVCGKIVYVTRQGLFFGGVSDEEHVVALRAAAAHDAWDVLGHSELWVQIRSGEYYVSSALIIHYVDAHAYTPPDAYVAAVLDAPK